MEKLANYYKEEEGYDTYYNDNAFCVYGHDNDEFFIAHFYVEERGKKSFSFFKEVCDHARSLDSKYVTANVDLNDANRDSYTGKLMVHLRNGFRILDVTDKRITVIKYL